MTVPLSPVFGKRGVTSRQDPATARIGGRSAPTDPATDPLTALPPAYASFFKIAHSQLGSEAETEERWVVPRSARAALLSGLVVGCALAGFDATGGANVELMARAAGLFNLPFDRSYFVPGLILLGLLGGARLSAVMVVAVHSLLARFNQTSFVAYAGAGTLASLLLAGLVAVSVEHAPAHGWFAEAIAGAASGFFYRVFAGTRPATTV